jgi:CheY-like chemotaxis protein
MTLPHITILIADDDEGHVILVQDSLRSFGLDNPIICFGDGQEVLDFIHGVHPKHRLDVNSSYLLLLDIRMPKVDGVETLRRIKSDPRFRKMPIIMLSTTDDPMEVTRCLELGCGGYVTKPVDYPKFAAAMQDIGLLKSE